MGTLVRSIQELKASAPSWGLMAISWTIGFATLGFEMSLARQATPYFGDSMPVWACLISTILASSFAGYLLGVVLGRQAFADTWGRVALGMAGGLIVLIGLLAPFVLYAIQFPHQAENLWAIFSFALLLLVSIPPVLLLCSISPILVQQGVQHKEDSGSVAGWLYAFSTLGGLLGSLLPPFLLFPLLGLRWTFFIIGLPAMLFALISRKQGPALRIVWFGLLIALTVVGLVLKTPSRPDTLVSLESPQNHLEVRQNEDGLTKLIVGPSWAVQSVFDPDGPSTSGSWPMFLFANTLREDCSKPPQQILLIGLGGGTLARDFRFAFPDIKIDGIEPDEEILRLAGTYFQLPSDVRTETTPARRFLLGIEKRYDLIAIDAYAGIYVPFSLVTSEFFTIAKEALTTGGVLAVNTLAIGEETALRDSIVATLRTNFDNVAVLQGGRSMNNLFYAWNGDPARLDAAHTRACQEQDHPWQKHYLKRRYKQLALVPQRDGVSILTDDHAPVEWLTHRLVLKVLGIGEGS